MTVSKSMTKEQILKHFADYVEAHPEVAATPTQARAGEEVKRPDAPVVTRTKASFKMNGVLAGLGWCAWNDSTDYADEHNSSLVSYADMCPLVDGTLKSKADKQAYADALAQKYHLPAMERKAKATAVKNSGLADMLAELAAR